MVKITESVLLEDGTVTLLKKICKETGEGKSSYLRRRLNFIIKKDHMRVCNGR